MYFFPSLWHRGRRVIWNWSSNLSNSFNSVLPLSTADFAQLQYPSKVSWQALAPWSSRLDSQFSKLSRTESWLGLQLQLQNTLPPPPPLTYWSLIIVKIFHQFLSLALHSIEFPLHSVHLELKNCKSFVFLRVEGNSYQQLLIGIDTKLRLTNYSNYSV